MPKRPPTPPSTDDSQFFTVVNPYPDQPYEALQDSITFVRWIACVVGEENLIAFYHKPKSPNVVIIEVSKEKVNLRRLLGEHRWSEVLRKPSKEEAAEASSIFPCKMNTSWSLEKIRWLRRDVETSWFKKWSPADDDAIAYPYPDSHFCLPPAEDITRERLCCPLRPEMFNTSSDRSVTAGSSPGCSAPAVSSWSSGSSTDRLPPPPGLPIPHFTPAIHGADVPKADVVAIDAGQASTDTTLWSGYGEETKRKDQEELCSAHNVLCHKGICKWCAERKRAEVREERARDRQKERDAWMRRREGRAGRTQSQSQASRDTSSDTSNSSRCGSPGAPSAPSGRTWRANKLQLRKDFLNKHNCKVVSISGGRTLPAHLRKGGIKTDSASSPVSIASTASSSSRASTAEDAQSTTCSSYDSSSYKSESDSSSPRSPHAPSPWSKTVAWQSHAKVPADDASSVASGETRDAFRNPWKRMPPIQSARPRWGDIVDHFPQSGFGPLPRVESRREDDETSDASEFDTEPF